MWCIFLRSPAHLRLLTAPAYSVTVYGIFQPITTVLVVVVYHYSDV
jgi:hypothetical protein